jgi:hypothetical protein
MRAEITSLVLAVCVLAAAPASGQRIGVFFDAAATDCDGQVPVFIMTTLYVSAILGGEAAGGITGVEFRIDGFPGTSTWFANFIVTPGCDLLCGPPHQGGANIAWPSCQQGADGVVLIGTYQVFAVAEAQPAWWCASTRTPAIRAGRVPS